MSLYLLTAILVMWAPDSVHSESPRIASAIVANSTLLALAALLASARMLSNVGDKLVDLVVDIVSIQEMPEARGRGRARVLDDL